MAEQKDEHSLGEVLWRYVAGRPLDGRDGYPYLRAGAGLVAGWQRQAWRLVVPTAGVATAMDPDFQHVTGVGGLALLAAVRGRQQVVRRRFHREYIAPTLAAIQPPLGMQGDGVTLYVDASLGNLTPRLAKPLSPAEERLRVLYGERIEPVVRWLPEQIQRGLWAVQRAARPATSRMEVFRRPGEQLGPRIELVARTPYLTSEQRLLVSSIINSKIPVSDLVESWHQVGPKVTARWVVRKRPPSTVGYDLVLEHMAHLKEWEFYIGQGAGNRPVVISLKDDSPHIAVSAGTGAGKSVLAMLIAVQILARGGEVLILDRKGSHRWALGMEGVDYCTKAHQMHEALIKSAAEADQRNDDALHEEEDWDPGKRKLVICEELNATIGQLNNYWAEIREKSDPKKSPAVSALADLLFMGRSAKYNVLAIAQMLTARAIGGPEARENFGVRCLARYTSNNWKMLVPEAAMPRSSRTLGRWQVVIGGQATEVQVAFLTNAQARALGNPRKDPDSALGSNVPGDGDMMTLRDAIDAGVLPWSYEAAKKRLQRDVGNPPSSRGKRANADLYARADLAAWVVRSRQEVPS
jgi:ATP:corrinoid adenosyltransferase